VVSLGKISHCRVGHRSAKVKEWTKLTSTPFSVCSPLCFQLLNHLWDFTFSRQRVWRWILRDITRYNLAETLVQRSPTVCLYVCDQETPKSEAKGPSWTISASEWVNVVEIVQSFRGTYYRHHRGLMMKAVSTSETSVNFYEITLCFIPQDSFSYLLPWEPEMSMNSTQIWR
jgi:hypothetical protein